LEVIVLVAWSPLGSGVDMASWTRSARSSILLRCSWRTLSPAERRSRNRLKASVPESGPESAVEARRRSC
jgi:hypothetical protein